MSRVRQGAVFSFAARLPRDLARDGRKGTTDMKKISTVRHYKVNGDGSLRFVGIGHVTVEEERPDFYATLAWRDAADAARRECEIESFEEFVDAAMED